MIEIDLQIVLDEATESKIPIRGFYLPTINIDDWIEALDACTSGCFLTADHRLFISPTSIRDIRASGLVYLTPAIESWPTQTWPTLPASARTPAIHSKSQASITVPLGAIGLVGLRSRSGQVEIWIPSNSRLEPAIALKQLAAKLEDLEARTYVWLPSVGLIAFEPADEIAVTSLLKTPVFPTNSSFKSWTALPDVEPLPDRIVDIIFPQAEPFEQLFEQLFEQEQEEIGGDASQLSKIDDEGNAEGQGMLGKLQEFISRQFEQWIRGREERQQQQADKTDAAGKSKGPQRPKLTDKLMNQMARVVQSQRDKQLDKLLKLMQSDPDKALCLAIPLAAMSAFRGLGRSSNRLTEQSTNFSLPRLFGSGPVDPWEINEKIRNQLQAAYRMQAERELAAGRFRRAAYIHAHLLGDLTAAATIMERGKAFREAAVIYGEKLKRPRDQARCLALAGQPAHAAKIYEDTGDFEAAAKVWNDVGDGERAKAVYRKAVEQKLANYQILAAAKILDEKLDDRLQAESLLWEQWPDGQEVLGCAELVFHWLAESGNHVGAREKFKVLTRQAAKRHQLLLAKLSGGLARQYPDRELRETAEDRCRIAAGADLRDVNQQEMVERLGLIRTLQNDDALLRRDTSRFEDIEKKRELKLQPVASSGLIKLNPLPALRMPELGEYFLGEMVDGDLFAMSREQRQLYGVRASVTDESKLHSTYVPILESDLARFFKVNIIHHHNGRARVILLTFQRTVAFVGDRELHPPAFGQAWKLSQNPLDLATNHELCGGFGQDGVRWSVSGEPFVLHGYSNSNLVSRDLLSPLLERIFDVPGDAFLNPSPQCKMLVVGNSPIIAVGPLLIKHTGGTLQMICDLGCMPNSMAASLPHTAPRIAIATDHSLKVVWLDRGDRVETIGDDEQFTHVCFVHGGRLLAATEKHLLLYNIYQGNAKTVVRLDRQLLQSQKVVSIMAITAEIVGILYQNGVIERYRVK